MKQIARAPTGGLQQQPQTLSRAAGLPEEPREMDQHPRPASLIVRSPARHRPFRLTVLITAFGTTDTQSHSLHLPYHSQRVEQRVGGKTHREYR